MKYEITKETKEVNGVTLHRIRAAMDFYTVDIQKGSYSDDDSGLWKIEAGTLGGWIEKESNLSQHGLSWVADEARVFGDAEVSDAAVVSGNAMVYGKTYLTQFARVYGDAEVRNAYVGDQARIFEKAKLNGGRIYGNAQVCGSARILEDGNEARIYVSEDAIIGENAELWGACDQEIYVKGHAQIYGKASFELESYADIVRIGGYAEVCGDAVIVGAAEIYGNAKIKGHSRLGGGIVVCGDACVDAIDSNMGKHPKEFILHATIAGDAYVTASCDCLLIGPILCSAENLYDLTGSYLTFCPTEKGKIEMTTSEFGTCDPMTFSVGTPEYLREELLKYIPFLSDDAVDHIIEAVTYAKSYFKWELAAKAAILEKTE